MIIFDNIIEMGTLTNVFYSLLFGLILIISFFTILFIKLWSKIKANAIIFIIIIVLIGPGPFLLFWLGVFGVFPIVLNSFIPGGLLEENKLKIEDKVIKENFKVNNVPLHCLVVKKWWDNSGENFDLNIDENIYNNFKKGQVVSLNSRKGIFGIRRIIKDDKYLKIISEPEVEENQIKISPLSSPESNVTAPTASQNQKKETRRRRKKVN